MKTKIVFFFLLISAFFATSQDFDWANEAGGNGSDQGYDIAVDNNGNSYVCGWFSDTAWFGSETLISHGLKDVFLAKYDTNGVFQWVQQGYGTGSNTAAGITLDDNGNIFITGWFQDEIHFGEEHLIAFGLFDMFVCKYSPEGEALWAQQTTGEQDNYGNRIAINPEGDVLVSGSFRHVVGFGNGIDFESAGDRDIFIANYSNDGEIQWVKQLGGKGEDRGYGIISDDNGNIYLTGFFNGICSFEDHNIYSPAITSVYVCKFDPAGNLTWVNHAFGNANDFARGYGIGIDENNKGQLLAAQKISLGNKSETIKINTSEFSDGIYLLQIKTPEGKFSSKFVVKH